MSCNNCGRPLNDHHYTCPSTTINPNCVKDPCEESVYSDCIFYSGPDNDCYGIYNGDNINDVIAYLVGMLSPYCTTTTTTTTTTRAIGCAIWSICGSRQGTVVQFILCGHTTPTQELVSDICVDRCIDNIYGVVIISGTGNATPLGVSCINDCTLAGNAIEIASLPTTTSTTTAFIPTTSTTTSSTTTTTTASIVTPLSICLYISNYFGTCLYACLQGGSPSVECTTFYLSSDCTSLGCNVYLDSTLTTLASALYDGVYSDGTDCYEITSGVITSYTLCSAATTEGLFLIEMATPYLSQISSISGSWFSLPTPLPYSVSSVSNQYWLGSVTSSFSGNLNIDVEITPLLSTYSLVLKIRSGQTLVTNLCLPINPTIPGNQTITFTGITINLGDDVELSMGTNTC